MCLSAYRRASGAGGKDFPVIQGSSAILDCLHLPLRSLACRHDESLIEMKKDIAEIHKMLSSMSPGSGHTLVPLHKQDGDRATA